MVKEKRRHWLIEFRSGRSHPTFEGKTLNHSWREKAACKGMDTNLFFPEPTGSSYQTRETKKICDNCSVQNECLDYSVTVMERYGIWGGTTMKGRVKIRSDSWNEYKDSADSKKRGTVQHLSPNMRSAK